MPSIHEIVALKRRVNGGIAVGDGVQGSTPPANGALIEGNSLIGVNSAFGGTGWPLHVSYDGDCHLVIRAAGANPAHYGSLEFTRSRGTVAGPSDVLDGDVLLGIKGNTRNTSWFSHDFILAAVDGAPPVNNPPPTRLTFWTNPSSDIPVERLRIDASGRVGIGEANPKQPGGLHMSYGGVGSFLVGAPDVLIIANGYYDGTWKHIGANKAAVIIPRASGAIDFYNTDTVGVADGAITWASRMKIAPSGETTISILDRETAYNGLVRTTAQFDKTDVNLANITGLSVAVAAAGVYSFRARLHVNFPNGNGVKTAVAGTCTATSIITNYEYIYTGLSTTANGWASFRNTALGVGAGSAGTGFTSGLLHLDGLIVVNAAGTLTIQFAQGVAGGTSSVLVGSIFEVKKVA